MKGRMAGAARHTNVDLETPSCGRNPWRLSDAWGPEGSAQVVVRGRQ